MYNYPGSKVGKAHIKAGENGRGGKVAGGRPLTLDRGSMYYTDVHTRRFRPSVLTLVLEGKHRL